MIKIKTLQHCGLVVDDLEKSRWFYGTVLGMEEVSRPKNFTFIGAWFRSGNDELHLITAKDTTAPPGFADPGAGKHTGLAFHFAFEVEDLMAVKTQLEAHNIEIMGGPMSRGDGAHQIYANDPDGHLIEFFQWIDDGSGATERAPVE